MKVRELIEMLENVNPESEVYFRPSNSYYVEDFGNIRGKVDIRTFWGVDRKGVIINSNGQVGAID